MTAPDPGLTDLIAAHHPFGHYMATNEIRCGCGWLGPASDWPAHVALVVEQHTNGRIAEVEHWKARSQYNYDCGMVLANEANAHAEKAEAAIVRVEEVIEDLVQNIADDERTLRSPNVSVGEAQELPAVINVQKIYLKDLRAALEGEQQ